LNKQIERIKVLSELPGVPGNEYKVAAYIIEQIKDNVDQVFKDHIGSVISKIGNEGPKIMIAGHMDEIGLMVTQITKEGFIKFQTLGGWFSQVMLAQEWEIHTAKGIVFGVTGSKPLHIIPAEKRKEAIPIDQMFIDVGVTSKDACEALGVEVGQMIVPHTKFKVLGDGKHLLGKAFDNRIGSMIVMEVAERLPKTLKNIVYPSFTVMEEVGLRGAKTSSHMVNPDVAIAVDTSLGMDVPNGDPNEQSLGKGPQILLFDARLIPNRKLRAYAIETAKKHNIPYQEAHITGGGTDAGMMHLAHQGALGLSICIPTRYIHSHTGIVHIDDVEHTIQLLVHMIEGLDQAKFEALLED
jgi:putative aminopeptidase FrvX